MRQPAKKLKILRVVDPLEERFKAAFGIYKHNKFRFTEDQEKIKIQNLEAKKKILDELKVLDQLGRNA